MESEEKLNVQDITMKQYVKQSRDKDRTKYNEYHRNYYNTKLKKNRIKEENKINFYNYLDAIKQIIIESNNNKDFEIKINKLLNKQTYDELINKLII
jgi:hypothetical protein